jgi:type II secretory pathway predicted ATPase ExeA
MKDTTLPPDGFAPTRTPFGKALADEEPFKYDQFDEIAGLLKRAVKEKAIAMVTGQAGMGKTTAIRTFVRTLPANLYHVLYMGQDQNGTNLFRRFALQLGMKPGQWRHQLALQLSQNLQENEALGGRQVVAVIDEAHLLGDGTLEDMRLLTNSDFDQSSPLTLILAGQLSLRHRLREPMFVALNQRIRYRYALEGFSPEECAEYIKHRLREADMPPDLFTDGALKLIYEASAGIPREVNNICTGCLMKSADGKVDQKLVKQVIDERELN